jgi:hypothetical protein
MPYCFIDYGDGTCENSGFCEECESCEFSFQNKSEVIE